MMPFHFLTGILPACRVGCRTHCTVDQLIDLKNGENVVEVCIVSAQLHADVCDTLNPGMAPHTFCTYDFYKHESEVTAQQLGLQPTFNEVSKYVSSCGKDVVEWLLLCD